MSRILLSITVLMLCTTVQAQDLPASVAESKTLNIALFPAFPPLAYRDTKTNELTGLDIDLADSISKDLGLKINWQDISYDAAVPALITGRVDMAFSMVNQPESRDLLDYVDYIRSGAQFYTRSDLAGEISKPTSLCGKKVGGSRRTNYPRDARHWSDEHCVQAGLPAIEVVGTEGSADARTQLKQRRIDAVVQSSESVPYTMSLEPGIYSLIGEPFATSYISIAFTKKNSELRDVIMNKFADLYKDGRYGAILDKYRLRSNAIVTTSINGIPAE